MTMLLLIILSLAGQWVMITKHMVFLLLNYVIHAGATNYPDELAIYLDTELARHSVAEPFPSPPFPERTAVSPLNSAPKKDSSERRIILDLSWPLNTSVNAGIDK